MKVSIAAVLVHTFSFVVSTGEALGQLTEERGGGQDLDAVVDSVNAAELQQTTRYTGSLQDSEDGRSKAQGGNGGSGGRRHHNNHGPRRHQDCNNNDIAECVELLEVLTNKDLGFAATVDELNKMCPVLLNGLQCIDNYTRRCLTQKHRDYFNKLYAGTIRVIKDLCNTRGRYQEEYIRHAPCMRQVNPKYNVCSVTYHRKTVALNDMQDASVTLSEDEKNRNVIILCCSFQEYLQCSERVVFETCGNETALFTKEFLDRMAGPIVQDSKFKCTKYAPGSQVCETAGSSGVNKASLLPLVAMLLILRQLLV
ncbi:uncharacterized protein LOC123509931 isoform X3 [Portunus trituberculatus]|uniref:uncharacterized protein LOC123509931 isoform X3 n=1 Tax=Portunus trituberculatus TaxID=210409 RepID=UPI001E1D112E|nr:uncharacterized protein LOC123509931 isoform X3 [Portunus trituberculatus]